MLSIDIYKLPTVQGLVAQKLTGVKWHDYNFYKAVIQRWSLSFEDLLLESHTLKKKVDACEYYFSYFSHTITSGEI